jgi:hypothetical protein
MAEAVTLHKARSASESASIGLELATSGLVACLTKEWRADGLPGSPNQVGAGGGSSHLEAEFSSGRPAAWVLFIGCRASLPAVDYRFRSPRVTDGPDEVFEVPTR